MIWLFIAGAVPNLYRAWQDRAGATKQEKVRRNLLVYGIAILLALAVSFVLKENLLVASILGMLTWRVCAFDYVVHAFLKRFSESHKNINIWKYTGKSTYWHDQLVSKIDWRVRLAIRVVLFVASLWWFIC